MNDCVGTCKGDCNNACTAANAAEVIANLGANLAKGEYIYESYFTELKDAVENELARRGASASITDYLEEPVNGLKIQIEAINKIYDDYADIPNKDLTVSTVSYSDVSIGKIIEDSDLDDVIANVKILMTQNIKN